MFAIIFEVIFFIMDSYAVFIKYSSDVFLRNGIYFLWLIVVFLLVEMCHWI